MPRDSQLYSPMSQALLRAARMGRINKPAAPPMEQEKEPGEEDDADGDLDAGFAVRRWTLVPKHLEGPEPEFLAKRRKGLPSFYTGTMGPAGTSSGQMRKTKIKKIDSEGNVSIWDVLVPDGQIVEGEIIEEEPLMTEAPAPGTVVEGVGVVNSEGVVIAGDQVLSTPPRRRPPPPKRKGKGIAKGKRKRVGFVSISKGGPPPKRPNGHLAVSSISSSSGGYALKPANVSDVAMTEAAGNDTGGGDTPMQDGEDGGEEGSEDDEDGEEGEENDREEGEISPSPSFSKSPSKTPAANTLGPDGDQNQDIPALILSPPAAATAAIPPPDRDMSSSPDLPLAAATQHQHQHQQLHQPQQHIFQHAPLIRIEPAQESVVSIPAPETIAEIPESQHISIAEPPPPDSGSANAQLPIDHDLLDGLVAPTIPSPLSAPQSPPPLPPPAPQLQPQYLEQEQQAQQQLQPQEEEQQQQPQEVEQHQQQPQEEQQQQQSQEEEQHQQQPQKQEQQQHQEQHEQHEQRPLEPEQRPPEPEPEPEPEPGPEAQVQPPAPIDQEEAHNNNDNPNPNPNPNPNNSSTLGFPGSGEEYLLGSLERSISRTGDEVAATTSTNTTAAVITTPTAITTASTTITLG